MDYPATQENNFGAYISRTLDPGFWDLCTSLIILMFLPLDVVSEKLGLLDVIHETGAGRFTTPDARDCWTHGHRTLRLTGYEEGCFQDSLN